MTRMFGWEFKRDANNQPLPSFTPELQDDGALTIAASGSYGTYVDLEGTVKTEAELVTKYREMSLHPEVDSAILEIVNQAVIKSADNDVVRIVLDRVDTMSPEIKKKVAKEFDNLLRLINFNVKYHDIFKQWYIDGRLYYHAIIDEKDPKAGLKELRNVDPRNIRKVREITKRQSRATQQTEIKTAKEYYIYSERGFNNAKQNVGPATPGLKIAKDTILHTTSGLTDSKNQMVLSYLHMAIKSVNQLRMLEDATIIYRLSRAPERRVWYIDIGGLPKMKAEQYVRDIMAKHKNRLVYDASTGEIRDDRKFMTMLEDYWLPRRDGGRGTEVTTLPAGQNLGQMEDVQYFQRKLYGSLYVPMSRLENESVFGNGRPSEITREEVKFQYFIDRLRGRFNDLFLKMLEKQVTLKQIMTLEEWESIRNDVDFVYSHDNYFAELKEQDIMLSRADILDRYQQYVGVYVSQEWIRKKILRQNDEEIKKMDEQMQKEQMQNMPDDPNAQMPGDMQGDPNDPQNPDAAPDIAQQLKQNPDRSFQDEATLKTAQQTTAQSKQQTNKKPK